MRNKSRFHMRTTLTIFRWIVVIFIFSFTTFVQAQSLVVEGRAGWLFAGWESLSDENKDGIDGTAKLLGEVEHELKAAKIKLLVLVVPMKALIYPEYLPPNEIASEGVKERYGYILSLLAREKIDTVDLRPLMNEVKQRHLAFYRSDYHWTPWSAEAAAYAVAAILKPNAASAAKISDTRRWREEKRFGDLANLLPRDRRKEIGEEKFTVRTAGAKGDLFGDTSPKVQVVGNSFVQPYLGFTQALSERLGEEVGLTWKYGDVGPWVTLLQYLQSDTFKKAPPAAIIWQWNEAQFANGPDAAGQWVKESVTARSAWLTAIKAAVSR